MAVRLSKIAREFNVGLSTIVEFLHSKGIKISSDPNAKLTDEDYALVAKEFSSDSQVKKESSLVDLKNTRKKKETVTIDNAGNISSGNEDTEEEEEEFISIKDEVRFENKIKIVDHIDLNPEKKTQPEPVEAKVEQPKRETQEEITEKVEEPKVGDYAEFVFEGRAMRLYRMPSSSRAYPLALDKKAAAYRIMYQDLQMVI